MKKKILEFLNKLLTGMSIGIVVALVPQALLSELAKALNLDLIVELTKYASSLLPVIMGLCIAKQFKLPPIHAATLAITTMIGAGSLSLDGGKVIITGIGDVINAGLTATFATLALVFFGNKLKAYTMLVLPTVVIVAIGALGLLTLPAVQLITKGAGNLVETFTSFTPIVATALISVTFAFLIISPISTVGVALAISLTGMGSAAANLGICAAGFGLAILGYRQNGIGTSLVHFLGSPKIQMANFIKKPKMILPILASALVVGVFAAIFKLQGTPISAGFGASGLVGPVANLAEKGYSFTNILVTILTFIIIPIITGLLTYFVFVKKLKFVSEEDYKIQF